MKNLKKLIALAITLITFVLVGCNNLAKDCGFQENGDGEENSKEIPKKAINLLAESDDGVIEFTEESEARTIMPAAADAETLQFYLVFRDTVNETTPSMEKVTFNKDSAETAYTRGTVTKSFNLSYYEFTLYALTSTQETKAGSSLSYENISTYASYIGTASGDLRYYDDVTFHLKVNTTTGGAGHLELEIENKDGWLIPAGYAVYAALYDDNDNLVYPTSDYREIYSRTTNPGTLDKSTKSYIKSAAESYDVPMGEYNLVVKYCKQIQSNGVTEATYEYSDKVIILMNEDTIATVTVPEILEKVPDAPSDFVVEYQNPSTKDSAYYPVKFKWTDNSKTEREFKIELLKYTSDTSYYTLPTSDSEWTTLTSVGTTTQFTKLAMQNSEFYIDGSLNKNSTAVSMYLPLGGRYTARLCAKNDAGTSDYTYVTWIATPDTGWFKFDEAVQTINRFRITYDLGGGSFYDNAATPAAISTNAPALVTYRSQYNKSSSDNSASETYNAILNPDGITEQKWFTDLAGTAETSTAVAITLALGKNFWDSWLIDNDTGVAYSQTNTYQNSTGTFIGNIKYYPQTVTNDTEATNQALGSQPIATGFTGQYNNGSEDVYYKVRKVTMPLYTGYKNLNLVAHYDTTLTMNTEFDDPALYELNSSWILTAFSKDGTAVTGAINAKASPDTGALVTSLENYTDGDILEVSLGLVNQITFSLDTIANGAKFPVTTYNEASNTVTKTDGTYDLMHLKVVKIGSTKDVKVNQDWNSSKAWTIAFKTWTEGKYALYFTATTSENPGHVYGKTVTLQITD